MRGGAHQGVSTRLTQPQQQQQQASDRNFVPFQMSQRESLGLWLDWRRGVEVSVVKRMNEVTVLRAPLILEWVTALSRYVTSQIDQLSLESLLSR